MTLISRERGRQRLGAPSMPTADKVFHNGSIKIMRLGRRIMIDGDGLDDWIASRMT